MNRMKVLTDARGVPLVPAVAACRNEDGRSELVLVLARPERERLETAVTDLLLANGYAEQLVLFVEDDMPDFMHKAALEAVGSLPRRHPGRHALLRDGCRD